MRTKLLVALCAAAVGACISCDNTIYRIEMTPHGEQITRQLDMTRNGTSSEPVSRPVGSPATQPYQGAFPAENVQHIAGQYQQSRQVAQNEVVFLGDFAKKLPDDVGNLGHYRVFFDPMGTANVYLEQFRGQSDQAANAQRVQESANTLADLITVYLRQNLYNDPCWPEFERFLAGGFRDDLRNLAVDLYVARAAGTVCTDSNPFMVGMDKWLLIRTWQFLIEHGYSTLGDLPAFKAIGNPDFAGPNILQRIVGRKMCIPEEQWPKRLAFLADKDKVGEAFLTVIESQESYQKWKRERLAALPPGTGPCVATPPAWESKVPAAEPGAVEPAASQPGPGEAKRENFLGELANVIMFAPTYPTPDALEMTMALPTKPVSTNGQWDSNTAKIKWSAAMPVGTNLPLPVICFASWSEPNVDFQHNHFGRLVLQGEELYDYVFWTKGLSADNAKQWQQMLEKTDPETAIEKLEGFRFRDDPKMTPATATQPATMPAGKATAWTQKMVEALKKPLPGSGFDRKLE